MGLFFYICFVCVRFSDRQGLFFYICSVTPLSCCSVENNHHISWKGLYSACTCIVYRNVELRWGVYIKLSGTLLIYLFISEAWFCYVFIGCLYSLVCSVHCCDCHPTLLSPSCVTITLPCCQLPVSLSPYLAVSYLCHYHPTLLSASCFAITLCHRYLCLLSTANTDLLPRLPAFCWPSTTDTFLFPYICHDWPAI